MFKRNITLIASTAADENFLIEVYFTTRVDEFALLGWDEPQIRHFLRMQYDFQKRSYNAQFPKAEHLLIRADDSKIGRMIINRNAKEIRLVDISILPEFRGKGVGTKLILGLLNEAGEKDLPVALTVALTNPGASRLYQNLGFQITDEDDVYISMEWRAGSD